MSYKGCCIINRFSYLAGLLVITVVLLVSCSSGMTKSQYISKYNDFVSAVRSEHTGYSQVDWQKADKTFERYSGVLYKKFKNRLTKEDEFIVTKCRAEYSFYRYKEDVKGTVTGVKDAIKQDISEYIDNDLQNDIDFLSKQAKKVSDIISGAEE